MIALTDKRNCCGCTACQHICPKHCISFQQDEEGFLYPSVDIESCIDCHLCEKVCPNLNRYQTVFPQSTYGCRSLDEGIRANSSSGGLFTILASKIISEGGIVFGARFMYDWTVAHDFTDSMTGLPYFRGSKYVQSKLGDSFKTVKQYLKDGRKVLFSGTPCQVSGLNHFLGKKYPNLITVDIVCHSIASPLVWKKYLEEISRGNVISDITFRDKSLGWHSYALKINGNDKEGNTNVLVHETQVQNVFMRGFLENLTVRPSCSACPARSYTSGSDIMLADFWHLDKYHPSWDDNKGMSLALVMSDKGRELFDSCKSTIFCQFIPYDEVEDHGVHLPITQSQSLPLEREMFFAELEKIPVIQLLHSCLTRNEKRKKRVKQKRKVIKYSGLSVIYSLCKRILKK